MTETAREADYVLPASSQFEKRGRDVLQPRVPAQWLPPAPAAVRAAAGHAAGSRDPRAAGRGAGRIERARLRAAAARGKARPARRSRSRSPGRPRATAKIARYAVDRAVPHARADAAAGPGAGRLAVGRRADVRAQPARSRRACRIRRHAVLAGNRLFDAILDSPSGLIFAVSDYADSWQAVRLPGSPHQPVPAPSCCRNCRSSTAESTAAAIRRFSVRSSPRASAAARPATRLMRDPAGIARGRSARCG